MNWIRVIFVNALVLLVLVELTSQGLMRYFVASEFVPDEVLSYIKRTNHARSDIEYHIGSVQKINGFLPKNAGENTIFIFSDYGNIRDPEKTVLLQGDSWARGIEIGSVNSFLNQSRSKKNLRFVAAAVGSYSPSLHSSQLGYLYKSGVNPDLIVTYIDQTDIGNEYCQYMHKYRYEISDGAKQLLVEPFEWYEPQRGYSYSPFVLYQNHFFQGPNLVKSFANGVVRVYRKIFVSEPCLASKLLELQNKKAENVFIQSIDEYLGHAKRLFPEAEIILVTHTHRRHLNADHFGPRYEVEVGQLIRSSGLLQKYNKVTHFWFHPGASSEFRPIERFAREDPSSHPELDGYQRLAQKIIANLKYSGFVW